MTTARAHFVTGTDTGIGKTLVACALVHSLRERGLDAVGMKPVASGAWRDEQGVLRNEDADALATVSGAGFPQALTSPYLFEAPMAPHVAARLEGRTIGSAVILDAFRSLSMRAQHVVVEGVGGFQVPLNEDFTTADLATMIAAPVIMVVGLKLGCINHALLTGESIRSRGLSLAGWVANAMPDGMLEQDATIAALSCRLDAPLLGTLPRFLAADPQMAAAALDFGLLLDGAR
jgi:dethiobiotin synthetase